MAIRKTRDDMKQVIYRSRPFGFDNSTLDGILMIARRNNRLNDITGALICRQDMYLQLVEGPEEAIDALFDRLSCDDRHVDVRIVSTRQVEERIFPEWAMLDDTEPSMVFSKSEVDSGALEQATPDALRAMFERIAAQAKQDTARG